MHHYSFNSVRDCKGGSEIGDYLHHSGYILWVECAVRLMKLCMIGSIKKEIFALTCSILTVLL